ncbi:MAG TPA: NADH:flavin oxidoreductase [Alphaproteobacteria bacterium]|nr:NADH:flavin oxidoreductase [Alphaproteobacteria bacterium]
MKYGSLFTPLTVGNLTLKNRIVMSPMTRQFSPGGVPTEDVAGYYRRRAEGGAGLIVTEGTGIEDLAALDSPSIPVMYGDAALAGWKHVVDEVHAAGGRIFPQLWHQGVLRDARKSTRPEIPGRRPSGLWGPVGHHSLPQDYIETVLAPTRPMTDEEIVDVIAAFARAAKNAVAVGFDGIALHGGHGYLIDSFLWHETNQRTDRWGGTLEKRAEFAAELVRAIRREIGPGVPIMFRFSQHKQQDYWAKLGQTPEELGVLLNIIADAGVDILDASIRGFDTPAFEGADLNLAGWAKKLTGKLSSTVGGIGLSNRLEQMFAGEETKALDNLDRVLERFENGEFDLILVGRGMLGDPAWSNRVRAGEPLAPFDKTALGKLT